MLTSEENGLKPFGYCYDRHPLPPIITHVVISTGSEMLIRWIISTPPQVTLLQPPTPLHFTLFHCKHRSALIPPTSIHSIPSHPTSVVRFHFACKPGYVAHVGQCGSLWASLCFLGAMSIVSVGAKTVQLSPIYATKIARIGLGFSYKFCSREFSYEAVLQ